MIATLSHTNASCIVPTDCAYLHWGQISQTDAHFRENHPKCEHHYHFQLRFWSFCQHVNCFALSIILSQENFYLDLFKQKLMAPNVNLNTKSAGLNSALAAPNKLHFLQFDSSTNVTGYFLHYCDIFCHCQWTELLQ